MTRQAARTQAPAEPTTEELSFQKVLDALVDPVRRTIVTQLFDAEADLNCGALAVPVAPSTSTHHFKVLREAGVISQYYVGTSRMNTLRYDDVEARFPGLLRAYIDGGRAG